MAINELARRGNRRVGIVVGGSGGGGLDPDAAAYIASAGITDADEIEAVSTMVDRLKAGRLWDASYLIYPISPTSLAAAAIPLKGVGFPMTWYNSPTHSSAGVQFGASSYGDTGYNLANEGVSPINYGYTVRSNMINANAHVNGSAQSAQTTGARNVLGVWRFYCNGGTPVVTAAAADTTIRIGTVCRRSATDAEAYLEGVSSGTNATSQSTLPPNVTEFIGGRNVAGSLSLPNAGISSWLHYHDGLSDTEATELYNIINDYTLAVR